MKNFLKILYTDRENLDGTITQSYISYIKKLKIIYRDRENLDGTITQSYAKVLTRKIANNYIEIAIALLMLISIMGIKRYVNADTFAFSRHTENLEKFCPIENSQERVYVYEEGVKPLQKVNIIVPESIKKQSRATRLETTNKWLNPETVKSLESESLQSLDLARYLESGGIQPRISTSIRNTENMLRDILRQQGLLSEEELLQEVSIYKNIRYERMLTYGSEMISEYRIEDKLFWEKKEADVLAEQDRLNALLSAQNKKLAKQRERMEAQKQKLSEDTRQKEQKRVDKVFLDRENARKEEQSLRPRSIQDLNKVNKDKRSIDQNEEEVFNNTQSNNIKNNKIKNY
jgi:hypothetical protein